VHDNVIVLMITNKIWVCTSNDKFQEPRTEILSFKPNFRVRRLSMQLTIIHKDFDENYERNSSHCTDN